MINYLLSILLMILLQTKKKDENDNNKEYKSQPKVGLESVDNVIRIVNDPPRGLVFDKKALSVLRLLNQKFCAIKQIV